MAKLTGGNERGTQDLILKKLKSGRIKSGDSFLSTTKGKLSKTPKNQYELELPNNALDWVNDAIFSEASKYATLESENTIESWRDTVAVAPKKVLILRVITGGGKQHPPSSESRVSDKWFGTHGDKVNARSHFDACSFGKFKFEPFEGKTTTGITIHNGVYTITVDADRNDPSLVESQATSMGNKLLGNLQSQFHHVALSVPDNNEGYAAYAYVYHWLSLYKDIYVDLVTVQMHEIGHNIGLAHSGEGTQSYGDTSGLMGAMWRDDQEICFNGPKNAQLGWYSDRQVDILGNGYRGDLYGIADYGTTTSDKKMILKLPSTGIDYYVTFNKATGVNSSPGEGRNQVLVHTRRSGLYYAQSTLVAKLSAGQSYLGGPKDIMVGSIGPNAAQVTIGVVLPSTPAPTPMPNPLPTPLPTPVPTPLPTPVPTPLPIPVPTPMPTPLPTPLPTPMPTPAPGNNPDSFFDQGNPQCFEDVNTRYFNQFLNDGTALTLSCRNLAKRSHSEVLTICASYGTGGGFSAARDACRVTCQRCTSGCNERSSSKFYWKQRENGKIIERHCSFLKRKESVWTAKKMKKVCSRVAPQGFSNGNIACPITCGSCSNL